MLNLTAWPISLQVILLLSDKNQFIIQFLTVLMIFLHETIPSKWKQGTFLVILHDGLSIYRYTFLIIQYTFMGWVWGGPAAHLYQLHARDTPPPGSKSEIRHNYTNLNGSKHANIVHVIKIHVFYSIHPSIHPSWVEIFWCRKVLVSKRLGVFRGLVPNRLDAETSGAL